MRASCASSAWIGGKEGVTGCGRYLRDKMIPNVDLTGFQMPCCVVLTSICELHLVSQQPTTLNRNYLHS
jgi:hypothetical protein